MTDFAPLKFTDEIKIGDDPDGDDFKEPFSDKGEWGEQRRKVWEVGRGARGAARAGGWRGVGCGVGAGGVVWRGCGWAWWCGCVSAATGG